MKAIALVLTILAAAGLMDAYPGMDRVLDAISSVAKRQTIPTTELLADLKTLPDSALSPAGAAIKAILLVNRTAASPQDLTTVYVAPGLLGSPACRADTCCVWKYIADEMAVVFKGESGRCTNLARGAVRLGFHDAGTWSKSAPGGGADGSFVLAGEVMRAENRGLENITKQMEAWYARWHQHGVGMADLVQMGATVAAVSCPLGPRVRSFVGRNDSTVPAPEGRLPDVLQDADSLIAMFEDKTIVPGELVSLIGAHTTSQQFFVDSLRAGDPQDSTPGVWDVAFYTETTSDQAPKHVFKFQSDVALSRHNASQELWTLFSDPIRGQDAWGNGYAGGYVRLSILGVEHINNLIECTGVLPLRVANFTAPDQPELERFLNSEAGPMSEQAVELAEGATLST